MYANKCDNMSFDINGLVKQNVGCSINYLEVNLIMRNDMLITNVHNRMHKLNMTANDTL